MVLLARSASGASRWTFSCQFRRMINEKLQCPHCRAASSVETVLDYSKVSWPNQRWLFFYCPACGKPSHIELSESQVSIGTIDGAPGPCFMPSSIVEVRDRSARFSTRGVKIRFAG